MKGDIQLRAYLKDLETRGAEQAILLSRITDYCRTAVEEGGAHQAFASRLLWEIERHFGRDREGEK